MPSGRLRLPSILLALLAAPTVAQAPPGPVPPADASWLDAVPAAGSPAELRWRRAREALQQNDATAARAHLLAALAFHPDSPPLLLDLARASGEPGAQALWLERFVRAAADAQGRLGLDAASRRLVAGAELAPAQKLATARAQAAAELARAVARLQPSGRGTLGNGAVARWLASAFVDVCGDAPALLRAHGGAFAPMLARCVPDHEAVGRALLQVVQGRLPEQAGASSDPAAAAERRARLALAAARVLAGLVRQAAFGKDVQGGPPPDLSGWSGALDAARRAGPAAPGEPRVFTIQDLEALDAAARAAFTLAHRDWADPGVALSTTGRYRIETTCGFETLLGAARTIELHHARLAGHFGTDPFAGRQGVVRIVPGVDDLETEGAPFWWAGGFQGGDRTVIRFAWGNLPDMGRALTHELTHRFDGALRPPMPAWYAEGHAQWTAGHYGRTSDAAFVDDYLDVGTCAHTFYKGYADESNLRKLLAGEVADYRDNYAAGYALYAFLRGYPPRGEPRWRAALSRFEQGARGQKDPVGCFTAAFCDGKDGRPRDLAGFVAEWRAFLDGCYRWLDERTRAAGNAWVGRYGRLPDGEGRPLVLDEPTWTWARTRAEPFFGQGHARAAGARPAGAGLPGAAPGACLWSRAAAGWQLPVARNAVQLLAGLDRADAATALQQLAHERFPDAIEAPASVTLVARLPALRAYADALAAAAAAQRLAGRGAAADALAAEQERLADRLGLPPAAPGAAAPPPAPRALLGSGFTEDSLTDFDELRVPGLWYATPEGDLHVGRARPRAGTGALDRQAYRRQTFVRTADWMAPGAYVLRARIHFTTAYVQGAVVIGHWRRDRDVRLHFEAGDYDYATGRRDDDDAFQHVRVHLTGQWERDGQLPDTAPAWTCDFPQPSSWFDLELHVRGPSVQVVVQGKPVFRYTTPDGSPIEGFVGFAAGQGAYRVQEPTLQRLDVAEPGQALAAVASLGLDPARQPAGDLDDLLHLPTRGFPRAPVGTLVLWLPRAAAGEDLGLDLPRALPVLARLLADTVEFPQDWVLAVPKGTAPAAVAAAQEQLRAFRAAPPPVLEHDVGAPFTGNPWVLFVDAAGILRAASEVGDPRLFSKVQKWARMFRAR